MSEAMKLFLRELNELTKRYGFIIDSAGCCGELLVSGGKKPLDIAYDYDDEVYRAF